MTAMELNALRGELARDILNIDSADMLRKIQRYIKRAKKTEEKTEYIEKEEILSSIREGLIEIKEARRAGCQLMTAEELLNEL